MEVAERRCPRFSTSGSPAGGRATTRSRPTTTRSSASRPSVSRFLYATGFSGHGFLQGPAMGEIVRDLVLGREPFVDVTPLSVERFASAALRPENNVI